ncbi:MAG: TatD family hydrolase [Endozoicomonas sp.]
MDMKLFDSHCHLDFPDFDPDRQDVLEQCMNSGVEAICIPATEAETWSRVMETIERSGPGVRQYAALGMHPCFMDKHREEHLKLLYEQLAARTPGVVAVGEIGLDYYLENSDRDAQKKLFQQQLDIAKSFNLPVILHVRKAHDDALKILRQLELARGGIVHAFSGSEQQAHQYIKLGFKLGFGGVITYPRARKTRHLAATLPLEAIVLETDSPDMPLYGCQGRRNSPVMVARVASELAALRKEEDKTIAKQTAFNCCTLFGVNLTEPSE